MVALALDAPSATGRTASPTHAVETTSFSASGFGAAHIAHAIDAFATVPSGLATSDVSATLSPGATSGGSARTASRRSLVTSDAGVPRSGVHARSATTAPQASPAHARPALSGQR